MVAPLRSKGMSHDKQLFSSYGDLAERLLPKALHLSFYGADGEMVWTRGADRNLDSTVALVRSIIHAHARRPQAARLSETLVAVAVPIVMHSKAVSVFVVHVRCDQTVPESRISSDLASAAAPLVDCLMRELGQPVHKALPVATLSERAEELEWLFGLTENLHSNSSDPRAISQLLSAAVERMRACGGAVMVPGHALDLTYSSVARTDVRCIGMFERCKPYFLNFVQRRKQPLIANKVAAGIDMPPLKVLLLPIEPHKSKVIGCLVLMKSASLPGFGRRQLFLGRHVGHQMGVLLESQYDLATGLLTRHAFAQDVERASQTAAPQDTHALLYFDLDRLQVINDVLGFAFGDEAIVRIAELLRAPALPPDAITSRIGGDSFVVYLPQHDAEQATRRAREILRSAAACAVGSGKGMALSMSCGIVQLSSGQPVPRVALGTGLAAARRVCRRAKKKGGNRVAIDVDGDAGMMHCKHALPASIPSAVR